jgi:hypothetical protein
MWTLETAIYVTSYSRLGQRVATAMEQVEGWTYSEYEDDGQTPIEILDSIPSLSDAINRMKSRGAIAFAMCPFGQSKDFLNRLHEALSEGTQKH